MAGLQLGGGGKQARKLWMVKLCNRMLHTHSHTTHTHTHTHTQPY